MSALSSEPEAMRRAWFWIRCNLSTLVLHVAGNQTGAAYERIGLIRAWKVRRMVSLSWPQDVPARAFRTWRRLDALAAMSETWGVKVNKGSKVTPKIFGFLSVGTGTLLMASWRLAPTWLVQGVKRVVEDLSGAIFILFALAQSSIGLKASESCGDITEASREMSGWETATVTSSA